MVAKKYKTVEAKKLARSRVNAQNYAKNRDRIAKRRKQQYAEMVQKQKNAKTTTRRKSTAKEDRYKPQKTGTRKTGSKEVPGCKSSANQAQEKSQKTVPKEQCRRRVAADKVPEKTISEVQTKSIADNASVKRPKNVANHKPEATSKNLAPPSSKNEPRRTIITPSSKNQTRIAIPAPPSKAKTRLPPTPSKQRLAIVPLSSSKAKTRRTSIPPTPSKCRIPHAKSNHLSSEPANEMDDIEYLTNYAGPPRPKVIPPVTGFQLAYDKVHNVFLDYKALVGPEWISGFFKKLHATYTKDGRTDLLDQSHDRIQNLLHLMEHRLAILELEATDEIHLTRVEMGRNMYDEILGTSRTLQRFRTAAAVGPGEVLAYMRTGKLRW